MKGSVCHELDTDLPVDELWAVYGTLRLVQLAAELLPNIVQKVSTVHGDGEVGTVIQVNFVPGELFEPKPDSVIFRHYVHDFSQYRT